MNADPRALFAAFREDHEILGRGFHEISALLRAADPDGARARAARLDREAGSHIAFEERHLYPALRPLIGDAEVDRLYAEHRQGLAVIRALIAPPGHGSLDADERAGLLRQSELMESHVAECGELFGTLGRIAPAEQAALYRRLVALRQAAPSWTDVAARPDAGGERRS